MVQIEPTVFTISAVIAVGAIVLKVWPMLKTLFLESAAFTKRVHDTYCDLRLESIRQRLIAIEQHEKEAKEAVREIWARLDTVVDQMHKNHADTLTAINGIGR